MVGGGSCVNYRNTSGLVEINCNNFNMEQKNPEGCPDIDPLSIVGVTIVLVFGVGALLVIFLQVAFSA